MTQPILCHFLIGLPGSGKSTFARKLNQQIPDSVIISTDEIRGRVFGDEAIQGDWNRLAQVAMEQIKLAIAYNQPIIYDATNVDIAWRSSFLDQVDALNAEWIAWWINTPLAICQQRNQKRSRQVPNHVIENYAALLQETPPTVAEGFIAVREISGEDLTKF